MRLSLITDRQEVVVAAFTRIQTAADSRMSLPTISVPPASPAPMEMVAVATAPSNRQLKIFKNGEAVEVMAVVVVDVAEKVQPWNWMPELEFARVIIGDATAGPLNQMLKNRVP